MPIMTNPSSEKVVPSPVSSSMCIRFLADPPVDAQVVRRFVDPRSTAAVKESAGLPGADSLLIVCMNDAKALAEKLDVVIDADFGKVSWQPGRAILQGKIG